MRSVPNVAVNVAVFVPIPGGGTVGIPDFDNTDGDADQFGMFAAVVGAASYDPSLPAAAAVVMRHTTAALLTWYDQLLPTLQRAADAVQGS